MGDGKAEEIAAQSQPGQQIPQKRHIQEGGQKVVPGVGILVSKPLADGVRDDVGVEQRHQRGIQPQIGPGIGLMVEQFSQRTGQGEEHAAHGQSIQQGSPQAAPRQIPHPGLAVPAAQRENSGIKSEERENKMAAGSISTGKTMPCTMP